MTYTFKNSDIDWIGNIPSHWEVKKLKNIANAITGITYSPDDIVDSTSVNAILVLRSSNIQKSKISFADNVYVNKKISKKYKTKTGDILICSRNGSRNLLGKNIIIEKENEGLTFGAFTTIVRSKYTKYIQYFLSSGVFDNILNSSSSTINQLTIGDLNNVDITFPPINEQEKIANYLDVETSKIDRKISILEQKFDKLEDYKQSVIFETVTKGLDSNVVIKDSGIDWIGDIPAHWEVKRVKDILYNLGGGNYGDDEDKEGILLPCISISDFKNGNLENTHNIKMNRIYKKKNIIKEGSILIEKSGGGDKVPVGRLIYVKNDIESYYTNFVQGIKILKNNSNYIYYCLFIIHKYKLHMDFVKQTTGLQNFEFNKFANNFLLPIPDIDSQNSISLYLNEISSRIDQKKMIIKKQIELLKEYKQSVIFEAVTGKVEIV